MRIDIQKIKAKNFFSIGNTGIEFDYRKGLYRVTGDNKDSDGRNGAGKSVVLCETLAFGFYGKPIRKITKDEMLNSTNEKGCEVEIYFKKEKSDYIIKRGIKPNFVTIEKDGVLQGENANMKTTQREIEMILGSDFQTFTHLLVMSNSYSTPFMDLDSSKKRSIIEDVLGIGVLGKMNDVIKKDYIDLRSNIKLSEKDAEYLLKSYNELKEYHLELKIKSDKFEDDKSDKLKLLVDAKNKLNESLGNITIDDNTNTKIQTNIVKLKDKRKEIIFDNKENKSTISFCNNQNKKVEGKLEELKTNPVCPMCNTKTDSEHIIEHIKGIQNEIDDNNSKIEVCNNNISLNKTKLEKIDCKVDLLESKLEENEEFQSKKKLILDKLIKVDSKYDVLINESNTLNELIDVDKESNKLDEYTTISTQLKSLHYKFNNLSFMRKILSDDGIKNYIIKKVIKYWNMKVNSYLSEMNVNFSIQFDENLDSVLKSRNRNCYSYHNFSGGERSRIDVAILLSMLDLSRLQNNIDLNLMVIDELFDSAIDTNGREEILNLFKNKSVSENKSIYVISHSSDLPTELFDKEITIYKKNGFTYV